MHPDSEAHIDPFLWYRDGEGIQRTVVLAGKSSSFTVGRFSGADVCLSWDEEVSRVHAELEDIGGEWTVVDAGLSRNGTFVNSERVSGRVRLRHGDVVRFGSTNVVFRAPADELLETAAGEKGPALTDPQRRVLVALSRPYRQGATHPVPAGNREIADELVLSIAGVRSHLRSLFQLFGMEDLPQHLKRARLVELAYTTGAITEDELR